MKRPIAIGRLLMEKGSSPEYEGELAALLAAPSSRRVRGETERLVREAMEKKAIAIKKGGPDGFFCTSG
jgi:hypothetical protein